MTKLQILAEIEGYDSVDAMLEAAAFSGIVPAICTKGVCDYAESLEPDGTCDCEDCGGVDTVRSCLLIAGLI